MTSAGLVEAVVIRLSTVCTRVAAPTLPKYHFIIGVFRFGLMTRFGQSSLSLAQNSSCCPEYGNLLLCNIPPGCAVVSGLYVSMRTLLCCRKSQLSKITRKIPDMQPGIQHAVVATSQVSLRYGQLVGRVFFSVWASFLRTTDRIAQRSYNNDCCCTLGWISGIYCCILQYMYVFSCGFVCIFL